MSGGFAAWTGGPDAPESVPAAPAVASWLPPSVARLQALDDVAQARAVRAEQRARADGAEAARDRAVSAYIATAAVRGEGVSGMDVAAGNLGRDVSEIFSDAIAAAGHEDARQAAKAHREAGLEPEHVMVGRSDGWPSSGYEVDRLVARAEDDHRWFVAYRARHGYAGALEAARSKAGGGVVSRSAAPHAPGEWVAMPEDHGVIMRVCSADGSANYGAPVIYR